MKILYVEDNTVNLALIQRIAQMNSHQLISFDEAEAALEALSKGEQVDLILLDIQLAGEMDGIGFAKEVRSRGWVQPIIAITAYAMMGDKERIIAAGCNEYLPKPLPIAEFLTLLAKYDPSVYTPPAAAPTQPSTSEKTEAVAAATPAEPEAPAKPAATTETATEDPPPPDTPAKPAATTETATEDPPSPDTPAKPAATTETTTEDPKPPSEANSA